jgi:adenylate cyclase
MGPNFGGRAGGGGPPWDEAMKLAEAEARTAVDLDPGSSIAHAILALVFSYKGDREPSLEEAEIAIALNPNDPTGHLCKGSTLTFSGGAAAGRESLATTLRLDPRGPTQPHAICNQAIGYYFERDYAAAEAMARRTIRAYPAFPRPYPWLPAALAQLGKVDEARGRWIPRSPSRHRTLNSSRTAGLLTFARRTTNIYSKACVRRAGKADLSSNLFPTKAART